MLGSSGRRHLDQVTGIRSHHPEHRMNLHGHAGAESLDRRNDRVDQERTVVDVDVDHGAAGGIPVTRDRWIEHPDGEGCCASSHRELEHALDLGPQLVVID